MNLSVRFSNPKIRKHVIAKAIVSGMFLLLPACHIPELRPAKPGSELPADFNRATSSEYAAPLAAVVGGVGLVSLANEAPSPENSAQLSVEHFYHDPTLARLIDQALAGNQDLRILNENVRIASNEVLSRQGAYLPFVTAGGGASLSKPRQIHARGAPSRTQLEVTPGHTTSPELLPNYKP